MDNRLVVDAGCTGVTKGSDPAQESNAIRGEMALKIDLMDALDIAQAAAQNAGEILVAMQGTAQVLKWLYPGHTGRFWSKPGLEEG